MRIIISPAKKMNVDTDSLPVRDLPVFLEQTEEICRELQSKSPEELQKLWKCNDQIAALNVERLRQMDLRPFDGVTPYRLEMQAKLKICEAKGLHSYWNNSLAEYIFSETDCIINLASKEYSICVSKYLRPGIRFITCVFGEEKDSKIIEKGTMCKMARGEMVRYMAEQQITQPEDIRAFDRLDYDFDPERSDESNYVFVKRGKAPCSLD